MIDWPTESEPVKVIEGDCLEVLPTLPADSFDSVVTDPPYGLEFMGEEWDHGVPGVEFWEAIARTLRPSGYLLTMGGTRTYHRLACAVEDAGFEMRDCLMWLYGSGFPKGQGCLKPAWEPILLARKPGPKVLPLGIDGCRVECEPIRTTRNTALGRMNDDSWQPQPGVFENHPSGRWPANVVHDGGEEVMEAFERFGERTGAVGMTQHASGTNNVLGKFNRTGQSTGHNGTPDTGTAARFFYCAKASRRERDEGLEEMPKRDDKLGNYRLVKCNPQTGRPNETRPLANTHPTVKPLALMRWLVRLVTPPDGCTLDPFGGSGTTGKAAALEGRRAVLIEREPAYAAIARKRVVESRRTLFAGVGA